MAEQEEQKLDKEFLLNNQQFLDDAQMFLAEREEKEVNAPEEIYDAFMEHFRYQNVNETTALRDLYYVNNQTDDEGIARFGRLMDTYDKMDSDFGLTAVQDYLGGVLTAPSTYASMFSFGAAKAGATAAQQGIKLGIKEVIKQKALKTGQTLTTKQLDDIAFDTARQRAVKKLKGEAIAPAGVGDRIVNITKGLRNGGYRAAVGGMAVETIGAGAGVTAQEMARVKAIDGYDEVDLANISLATGVSALTGGLLGGLTGAQKAIRSNVAEQYVMTQLAKQNKIIEKTYKTKTAPLMKSKTYGKLVKQKTDTLKLSLEETVGKEAMEAGKKLKKDLTPYENLTVGIADKEIANIAAAAVSVVKKIGPREGVKRGSEEDFAERITSRIARGLKGGQLSTEGMVKIMQDHGISLDQFSAFYVADISEAARKLGTQGRLSKAEADLIKKELTEIDKSAMELGSSTEAAYVKAKQLTEGKFRLHRVGDFVGALNKTRIGLMTVQAATTVRNTTNGFMRNYVYALENVGSGLYNLTFEQRKRLGNQALKDEAKFAVKTGVAQLRAGGKSLLFDDLFFGMQSQETAILTKIMRDPRLGRSAQAQEMFRELGDIAGISGVESSPMLRAARFFNTFNTMSDNMFKSAIFSREIDKAIALDPDGVFKKAGIRGLDDFLKKRKFSSLDNKMIARAMDEALDFTYQTGRFKGREGVFNSFADTFIQGASSTFGSTFVPFPRYLINQFRFVYEHMPVLGMLNMGGILNKTGGGAQATAVRFGKQFSGLATLGAFYYMRVHHGDETTKFYEYNTLPGMVAADENITAGGTMNVRAALGPFTAFAYVADLLYRMGRPGGVLDKEYGITLHDNDKVSFEKFNTREAVEALAGSQFRAGTGLDIVDGLVKASLGELSETDISLERNIAKYLGNYLSTYTVGAGMLRDIYGQYDPAYANVAVNEDIEFIPYLLKQATRTMPVPTDDPILYSPLSPREAMQSTTKRIPLRNVNPLLRQITGLSLEERKNYAEKELNRLQFDWVEVAPRRTIDPQIDNEARKLQGEFIEEVLSNEVVSPSYQAMRSDTIKRRYLRTIVQAIKSAKVSTAMEYAIGDVDDDYKRKNRARFYKEVPADIRKIIIKDYNAEEGHGPISETEDFETLLKMYREDYKEPFSKKRVLERLTRDILTDVTDIDTPSSKQFREGVQ